MLLRGALLAPPRVYSMAITASARITPLDSHSAHIPRQGVVALRVVGVWSGCAVI